MVGLWSFGSAVVTYFGPHVFVMVWVGAGLSGAAWSLWYERRNGRRGVESRFIGASGSVMGMSTAFAAVFPMGTMMVFPVVSTSVSEPVRDDAERE